VQRERGGGNRAWTHLVDALLEALGVGVDLLKHVHVHAVETEPLLADGPGHVHHGIADTHVLAFQVLDLVLRLAQLRLQPRVVAHHFLLQDEVRVLEVLRLAHLLLQLLKGRVAKVDGALRHAQLRVHLVQGHAEAPHVLLQAALLACQLLCGARQKV